MKKSLKKEEIQVLWNGLSELSQGGSFHKRFSYGIARNLGNIRGVIQALEETTKAIPEFEEKRAELVKEMAITDDAGNPVMIPGTQRVQIPDMNSFNKQLEALREETGQDKRDAEVKELLQEAEDVDIYMVDFEFVPEQFNPALFAAIEPMIREPGADEPPATTPDAN